MPVMKRALWRFILLGAKPASARDLAPEQVSALISESGAEVSVAFPTLGGIDDEDESAELIASTSSLLYEASQR